MPRRFQFGLTGVFAAMLLVGVVLTLAMLPEPANLISVYLLGSFGAAQLGSKTVWRAVVCGALGGLAGFYLVCIVQLLQGETQTFYFAYMHIQGMCCCFPLGAQIGFLIGYFAQERRFQDRLKSKIADLEQETAAFEREHRRSGGDDQEPPTPD
jgi:hypothetical protein